MMRGHECICLAMDEAYLLGLRHFLQPRCDFHLLDRQPSQMIDFRLDARKHTRKETMKEATAGLRQKFRARLLTKRWQVSIRRICNHDIAFFTHQQAHSPHTSAPTHHHISLTLQKHCSNIDVLTLLLPQRYKPLLIPQPASTEIEASQSHSIRQRGEKQRSLKPTRSISMQIQQDIFGLLLGVKCQLEGNLKVGDCEAMGYAFAGLQDVWIVVEPWRTDQHEGQLLDNAVGLVTLHLVGERTQGGS